MRRWPSGIRGFAVFDMFTPKVNSADPWGLISISLLPKIVSNNLLSTVSLGAKARSASSSSTCKSFQYSVKLPAISKLRYSSRVKKVVGRYCIVSPMSCWMLYIPVSSSRTTLYVKFSGHAKSKPAGDSIGLNGSSLPKGKGRSMTKLSFVSASSADCALPKTKTEVKAISNEAARNI